MVSRKAMKKTDKPISSKNKSKPKINNHQKNIPIHLYDEEPQRNDIFDFINKYYQANLGKFTASISPASTATSYFS